MLEQDVSVKNEEPHTEDVAIERIESDAIGDGQNAKLTDRLGTATEFTDIDDGGVLCI